jgi:hypothetical protein
MLMDGERFSKNKVLQIYQINRLNSDKFNMISGCQAPPVGDPGRVPLGNGRRPLGGRSCKIRPHLGGWQNVNIYKLFILNMLNDFHTRLAGFVLPRGGNQPNRPVI